MQGIVSNSMELCLQLDAFQQSRCMDSGYVTLLFALGGSSHLAESVRFDNYACEHVVLADRVIEP